MNPGIWELVKPGAVNAAGGWYIAQNLKKNWRNRNIQTKPSKYLNVWKPYCAKCEWCKSLEGSDGEIYHFCMDAEGGAFLGITGILGWCTVDAEDENEETGDMG